MKIHTIRKKAALNKIHIKRVAAYARVSSTKPEAEDSLLSQVSYYKNYIAENASYELAGIYADNAISGTNPNRPEFQRMMSDARAGKIDLIVTKSITRFARNIITLLTTLRELKTLGIDVIFEKENMHSMDSNGELLLTLLAYYAEGEARSASENKNWQIQKQFERGIPTWNRMLGLKWVNGQFKVVPEEARIVKHIFELYLEGKGIYAIIAILDKEKWTPLISSVWNVFSICRILRNEKYAGDLLLQKTYTLDFRSKKKCINRGERRMFYIEDAHDAIIPREMFNKVQAEIRRRQKEITQQTDFTEKLFSGVLKCHNCGWSLVRKHRSYNNSSYFWKCRKYDMYGKNVCSSKEIRESILIVKTKQVLNIPESDELTRDFLLEKIDRIEVMPDHQLRYFLKSGEVKTVAWETPSRSKSWTPEMRERARQRSLQYYKQQKRKMELAA